jgi:hypothetical protein
VTGATLLLRQIHPAYVQNGDVSSQAFRPTAEHEFKLSMYNGDLIEAKPSWVHFTTVQRKESAGVQAVTVSECKAVALRAVESPEIFAEHCHIDFSSFGSNQIVQKGRLLRDRAATRGWLFRYEN